MDPERKQDLIPKAAALDQFSDLSDDTEGIYFKDIPENALIEVETTYITLHIAIIDQDEARVAVQRIRGKIKFFSAPEICRLEGSTLGGSFLKRRWLGIGFNLELHRLDEPPLGPARRFLTSAMHRIDILDSPAAALELIQKTLKNRRLKTAF